MADQFVAEIRIFAGNFAPTGWATCDGQLMPITQNTALFSLLGTTYGGDGRTTFGLPNLDGRCRSTRAKGRGSRRATWAKAAEARRSRCSRPRCAPHTIHCATDRREPRSGRGGQRAAQSGATGNSLQQHAEHDDEPLLAVDHRRGQPHNNMMPYLSLTYIIALQGVFPARSRDQGTTIMSAPFLGELKIVSFNFPPKGWALCNGQLLPINQNQALFSILGTTYGGDGRDNFALPNLQGRVPVHVGNGIILGDRRRDRSYPQHLRDAGA